MDERLARRLRRLSVATVLGLEVRVAESRRSRLLGLALLRRSRAGLGLLMPRCRSIHTLGMLFRLDLYFIDASGEVVRTVRGVGPGRVVGCRAADAVLELPQALSPIRPGSRRSTG